MSYATFVGYLDQLSPKKTKAGRMWVLTLVEHAAKPPHTFPRRHYVVLHERHASLVEVMAPGQTLLWIHCSIDYRKVHGWLIPTFIGERVSIITGNKGGT